ncbi:hypothetical protein BANRA_03398 [Acinetobacter baumannii]|nr:hypothetical protein BANRA_03398 [Acinetobacter baumannii]
MTEMSFTTLLEVASAMKQALVLNHAKPLFEGMVDEVN